MATSPKQKAKAPAAAAPVAVGSEVPPNRFPLFKGATRVATVPGGVPTRAFAALVFLTVTAASFTLWGWLLFPALYPIMAIVSRNDDRAFWIWELWLKTKIFAKNKGFWGAVSLTPTPYSPRRPWARGRGVHNR